MTNTVDHVREYLSLQSKGAGGEEQGGVERGEGLGSEEQAQLWQEREAEAVDLEFHRELEVWDFPAYSMSV